MTIDKDQLQADLTEIRNSATSPEDLKDKVERYLVRKLVIDPLIPIILEMIQPKETDNASDRRTEDERERVGPQVPTPRI